jgi:hypothetical protein
MRTTSVLLLIGGLMLGAAVMVMVGCETTKSSDMVITWKPDPAVLTKAGESVIFYIEDEGTNTSGALQLPLEWSVSDPSLGFIHSSSALIAVYVSKGGKGINMVTVRDQAEHEGAAVVTQE